MKPHEGTIYSSQVIKYSERPPVAYYTFSGVHYGNVQWLMYRNEWSECACMCVCLCAMCMYLFVCGWCGFVCVFWEHVCVCTMCMYLSVCAWCVLSKGMCVSVWWVWRGGKVVNPLVCGAYAPQTALRKRFWEILGSVHMTNVMIIGSSLC